MALKPTIYKLRLNVSNLNNDFYDSLSYTIAQHPSESLERMTARICGLSLLAKSQPELTRGLSEIDEPDFWCKNLHDRITLWGEVGEPSVERVKKACRQADEVYIFSFNSKSQTWFEQNQGKLGYFSANIIQFDAAVIEKLAQQIGRTMDWSVTITEQSAYFSTEGQEIEVSWKVLQGKL